MTANLTEGDITTTVLTGGIVAVVPAGVVVLAEVAGLAGPAARLGPDVKDTTTHVVKDTTNHEYR